MKGACTQDHPRQDRLRNHEHPESIGTEDCRRVPPHRPKPALPKWAHVGAERVRDRLDVDADAVHHQKVLRIAQTQDLAAGSHGARHRADLVRAVPDQGVSGVAPSIVRDASPQVRQPDVSCTAGIEAVRLVVDGAIAEPLRARTEPSPECLFCLRMLSATGFQRLRKSREESSSPRKSSSPRLT
jgi:hypothetical protein